MIKSRNSLIFLIVFYILFAWRSWKLTNAPVVDGLNGTNEIYLVAICALLIIISYVFFSLRNTVNHKIVITIESVLYCAILIYVVSSNMLFREADSQIKYATVCLLLPMLMAVLPYKKDNTSFMVSIFMLSTLSIIYAIVGIINFIINSQARMNLPIGVATTVVFYFIAMLPVVRLSMIKAPNKTSSYFFFIGYILLLIASILTVSRAGIAVAMLITGWNVFEKSQKNERQTRFFKWFIVFVVLIIGFSFLPQISDLIDWSRLVGGFSDSSTSERIKAALLGLEIFKNNWLFGASNGAFFTRLYSFNTWTDKIIYAYGKSGLLDPHNGYVLLLSENGVIGFVLFVLFFISIVNRIHKIKDPVIRTAGYQLVLSTSIYSLTSSDLFTVVGLATVIWLIYGLFISYSYNNAQDEILDYRIGTERIEKKSPSTMMK